MVINNLKALLYETYKKMDSSKVEILKLLEKGEPINIVY